MKLLLVFSTLSAVAFAHGGGYGLPRPPPIDNGRYTPTPQGPYEVPYPPNPNPYPEYPQRPYPPPYGSNEEAGCESCKKNKLYGECDRNSGECADVEVESKRAHPHTGCRRAVVSCPFKRGFTARLVTRRDDLISKGRHVEEEVRCERNGKWYLADSQNSHNQKVVGLTCVYRRNKNHHVHDVKDDDYKH